MITHTSHFNPDCSFPKQDICARRENIQLLRPFHNLNAIMPVHIKFSDARLKLQACPVFLTFDLMEYLWCLYGALSQNIILLGVNLDLCQGPDIFVGVNLQERVSLLLGTAGVLLRYVAFANCNLHNNSLTFQSSKCCASFFSKQCTFLHSCVVL